MVAPHFIYSLDQYTQKRVTHQRGSTDVELTHNNPCKFKVEL